ncbi:Colicin V production protein [Pseudovibrio sp. W64]|uniref:CvpA family protein n=1 Tax=unclassified Pseudovibrio TaxID=2627060 RepID=UPI00070D755A|nr:MULTISPECIES: CvpA family protein [unclassified Pseudovibrio]KZK78513.1 Colicin V production protein [Pseudovibrio sp. W64]KZK82662.1 Colicin V production protein [Pseudovibrio sp. Ad13]KZK85433.1 Colicin V production protein [Pseudovibrio sp. Ad46]KZL02584.1 Colicin V production protein [Pseudovibrio sp. W74]KZL07873.1 Colicin V production protein [Pseudovibrio sp. Ad14]
MPITLLDGILLVIMLISGVLAMIRGFVREVLSIASWVAAAVAAYLFYGSLKPFVLQHVTNDTLATAIAAGAVFLVTLIVVSYITMRISDFVLDSRIGALDRTLGFVFGAARGFLLVVVALLFFNWFVPEPRQPNWIMDAKSRHLLVTSGQSLVAALPEDPERAIMDQIRKQGGTTGSATGASSDEEARYSPSERRGLDQLTASGEGRN